MASSLSPDLAPEWEHVLVLDEERGGAGLLQQRDDGLEVGELGRRALQVQVHHAPPGEVVQAVRAQGLERNKERDIKSLKSDSILGILGFIGNRGQ